MEKREGRKGARERDEREGGREGGDPIVCDGV